MRRKDREVTDAGEILDILLRCDTVRLGMRGTEYPYVVPVSFGAREENGAVAVYFHCARQGMKLELLREDDRVCVEAELFYGIEKTGGGITARYESVIGFGRCRLLEETDERVAGLRAILEHYGYSDYPLEHCAGSANVLVGRVTLESITGKRNLPGR